MIMLDKPILLHYSPFPNNAMGHGGAKRTHQIVTVLSDKFEVVDFKVALNAISIRSIKFPMIVWGIRTFFKYGFPFKFNLKGLIRFIVYGYEVDAALAEVEHTSKHFLLEDFTALGYTISFLLDNKYTDFKLFGVVHNIESLVASFQSKFSQKKSPHWFMEELESIKRSDICITISREENWLLSLYGIDSIYLPFQSTKQNQEWQRGIAESRKGVSPNYFLLLGSIKNAPTRKGTLDLVEAFTSSPFQIHIAGFGTEDIRDQLESQSNITVHGTVSKLELEKLLLKSTAVIIFQNPTTGVLTRIDESLGCGVPIFANVHAARSYYSCPGVTIYEDFDHLKRLLRGDRSEYKFIERVLKCNLNEDN
jgi:glycosyltransferase involved in cell wall biosynthesis